jgi:hypothetical protein
MDPHPRQPTSNSGAPIQAIWTAAAVSVRAHITIRQTSPNGPGFASRKAGVAVPAMRKKIIA